MNNLPIDRKKLCNLVAYMTPCHEWTSLHCLPSKERALEMIASDEFKDEWHDLINIVYQNLERIEQQRQLVHDLFF